MSKPPTARFNFSPALPVVNVPVSFDGSSSTCTQGPCTYKWTDDADGSLLGVGVRISFTFRDPGVKYVRLTVINGRGLYGTSRINITVSAAPSPTPIPPTTGVKYVDVNGSDSNSGDSIYSPWKTIQKAADTLNDEEMVLITPGEYPERVTIHRNNNVFEPMTGTVVTRGFIIQGSQVRLTEGFEITKTSGASWADRTTGSGIYLAGTNNQIVSPYIHDTVAAGIYCTPAATNNSILGAHIAYAVECGVYLNGSGNLLSASDISHTRSVGGSDADGVRFFGDSNIVSRNYIHNLWLADSPGNTPHLDAFQTWGPATNYIFERNIIDKSPDHRQGITIEGISQTVRNIIVRNNIIISRGTGYQPAVNVGDGGLVSDVAIVNNTIVSLGGPVEFGVWVFSNARGVIVKNNALYDHGNSGEPYIKVQAGAGVDIGYNSISKSDGKPPIGAPYAHDLWMVDPKFVNLAALDFHLQASSPLIGAGTPLAMVTDNFDGDPRTAPYNIGAY